MALWQSHSAESFGSSKQLCSHRHAVVAQLELILDGHNRQRRHNTDSIQLKICTAFFFLNIGTV